LSAFEQLYRAYWDRLYRFAFRYVRSKADAEDIVQEVFFRIWRGRTRWNPTGVVQNYLYRAVHNAARDRFERAAALRRRMRFGWWVEAADSGSQPDFNGAQLTAAVERALTELPSRRGTVCRLRLIDGLSYVEIAARLGISAKTVETQLARGLKFLRDRMRQHSELLGDRRPLPRP
jgi:RNA polymerase sigma-70 factor (ECF subfamily)